MSKLDIVQSGHILVRSKHLKGMITDGQLNNNCYFLNNNNNNNIIIISNKTKL